MNPPSKNKALAVFLKNKILGQVKTRLAKDVGSEKALEIYSQLCTHTLNVAKAVNAEIHGFYTNKKKAHSTFDKVHLQNGSDLGEKMKNAFALLLERHERVVLIGSDLPELSTALIEKAYDLLEENDVVLGPAIDGGYYLIGLRSVQPHLFEKMSYSHPEVLAQTLKRAKELKLSVAMLEPLRDLDTLEDLKHFNYLIDWGPSTP
ncbi:MAG: TIGR04282 family arsenosugar biosynthesis glycosyltransferase [Flavobacteriaceae bacterium]|jgi:hypothetical protein